MTSGTGENWGAFLALWVLLSVLALIPVVQYEVASTVGEGQTFGKRRLGIRVVPWDGQATSTSDQQVLKRMQCVVRWAIPHVAWLVITVVAGVLAFPIVQEWAWANWFVFYGISGGAGLWAMMLVYLSSVLDENGRGWHDKAAGTIVVMAPDPHMQG